MSGGTSKSSSKPVDMTPQPFQALQTPFASVLAGLLGFQPSAPSPVSAGTPASGPAAPASGTGGTAAGRAPGLAGGQLRNDQVGTVSNPNLYSSAPPGTSNGHVVRNASGVTANQGGTTSPLSFVPMSGQGSGNFANDLLNNFFGYQGPITAGTTGNEESLLARLMGQQDGSIQSDSQKYLSGMLAEDPSAINPFLSAAIEAAQRPTFQALEQTLSRTLPGRFTEAGQFTNPQGSSAFDRAAALAARDSQQTAADIATNLSFGAYDADQNRRLDAAKSLPGVTKQEVDTTIANLQAQALPRLIQEAGIERGMELFQNRVNGLLTTLGITAGVTSPTIASEGKSSSSQFALK